MCLKLRVCDSGCSHLERGEVTLSVFTPVNTGFCNLAVNSGTHIGPIGGFGARR